MDTRYLIIKEKKLLLSDIPKSGSQSMRKVLVDYYGRTESIWKMSDLWTNNIYEYSYYKLISLVRNPYDRLVSAYYDKFIISPSLSQVIEIFSYYKREKEEGVSFSEFCMYLYNLFENQRSLSEFDPHWKPQNLIIGDVKKPIIIKMEDKNKEKIFKKNTGLDLPLYHSGEKNGGKFTEKLEINGNFYNLNRKDLLNCFGNTKRPNYKCFYDKKNLKIVQKLYEKDFELLEYPTDIN